MSNEHALNMRRGSFDYDLHVIDAQNTDTTIEQFRDCIYDALQRLDERLNTIDLLLELCSDKRR